MDMVELLTFVLVLTLLIFAVVLLADSDDDNSSGGLMEPALIPIPIREHRN